MSGPLTQQLLDDALRRRGWQIGRDLQVEYRLSNGDTDLTRSYASELISLKPDVLFAITNTSMAALHAQGSTIPTVFAMVSDPVAMHYVDSYANQCPLK